MTTELWVLVGGDGMAIKVREGGTMRCPVGCCFFFQAEDGIRDVAVTGVQTCALPIWNAFPVQSLTKRKPQDDSDWIKTPDRKSTRLNSSHGYISYAVFCLKKKKK